MNASHPTDAQMHSYVRGTNEQRSKAGNDSLPEVRTAAPTNRCHGVMQIGDPLPGVLLNILHDFLSTSVPQSLARPSQSFPVFWLSHHINHESVNVKPQIRRERVCALAARRGKNGDPNTAHSSASQTWQVFVNGP